MSKRDKHIKEAVALTYDEDIHPAPKLVAKGKNDVADEIIRIANENNIPVQEDATLVSLLSELEINETIPEELYEVVAEIFAFIYNIEKEMNES